MKKYHCQYYHFVQHLHFVKSPNPHIVFDGQNYSLIDHDSSIL